MNRAHICLIVPPGGVHALGLLDPARYLAAQLTRLGVETTLAKNRVRGDAVNLVFGAHLGFDPAWAQEFRCVLVNLEQLGEDARVPLGYPQLLRTTPTIDYHPDNVRAYRERTDDVPLLGFGVAEYLHPGPELIPIEQRPIDLLFVGSMNERREALIQRIEKSGVEVAIPDTPVFGPERDALVRQSKAVLNLAHYSMARFEQVRAFLVLSQGTPLVSERYTLKAPGEEAFRDCVHWFDPRRLEEFFAGTLTDPGFAGTSRELLARFATHDALESVKDVWEYAVEATAPSPPAARRPLRVNATMGTAGYRPGWLNVDPSAHLVPDWQHDLGRGVQLPVELDTTRWGRLTLAAGTAAQVDLGPLDPASPATAAALDACLQLLAEDGVVVLDWPASSGLEALDPFTRQFWLSGWLEHRFSVRHAGALDAHATPCRAQDAVRLRVVLVKVACTLLDITLARASSEDLGLLTIG